ncbi:hypothetical protein PYW07_010632 [Mythimna separata]|uniref:CUB domain-containing protein n=1 Tax=Mythimna separata TaxID=271217 RepID=A0AAD8DLN0_MYTSE|nr:hypothetical protein PYW07_010632 [Mythimna separata]
MRVILCVVLFTFGAAVQAQQDYQDYWQNDYANYDNYNDAFEESNEDTEVKLPEATQAAIQDAPSVPTEAPTELESNKFDDYQIEDNRSESTEKQQADENKEVTAEATVPEEAPASPEPVQHKVLPLEAPKQSDEEDYAELGLDNDAFVGDEADAAPLPVPEIEENNNENEGTKEEYMDELGQEPVVDDKDLSKIIEETKQLLAESDDAFDANDYENSDEQDKNDEEADEFNEDDTPEKVYKDLNADLDKLFETLDKLADDTSDETEKIDEKVTDAVKDYEEKYGKPYKEDVALSWRNAEVDAAEPEEANQNDETGDENDAEGADDIVSDEEAANDDYELIDDSNLSKIFALNLNASNENAENDEQELVDFDLNNDDNVKETTPVELQNIDAIKNVVDYLDDPTNTEPNADDDIDSIMKQIFPDEEPKLYGNDALVDEKKSKEDNAEEFETKTTNAEDGITVKSVMVDDLNSAELSDLMTQFVAAHKEEFDVNSENFEKHVMPIHIILSVNESTVVTSPDFPKPYPTNNIVDWVFDGPGMGIEINITDFAVNGAFGDYLLVKPGGLDDSGHEGLIFSHHLTSVRKYRFADVDRMFVRFKANPGEEDQPGFSFSVKLIWPLPAYADDEPIAEPVADPPKETMTLNLAGLTLPKFNEIREQFLELLADMAKEYIRDNDIAQGMNTTWEVTQITRTAVCNIQWPEYENCVEVTFGVPLHYEEEPEEPRLNAQDLNDMWTTYIVHEEFSARLRSLGITEYAIPNDRTVLMVWLVITAGVLISMAMLAFALWRFSCFEDYTRMQVYGDTDSVQSEKRNLDLYPTPHQTLPPLYSENDYKWADDKYDDSTRVDMGGFANRSYIRDEIYDLDSDEDVITPRDSFSKGAISPRDFSEA